MATKTERMICDMNNGMVTYKYQTLGSDGESWVTTDSREFAVSDVADLVYVDGEAKVTMLAYGVRAWLADRTSQFRKLGGRAVLEAMDDYWETAKEGQWTKRKGSTRSAGPDMALAQVIADLKGIDLLVAVEVLKTTDKAVQDALRAKYAKEYKAAQAAWDEAQGVDLGDLL